jgi:hypothetical protein
LGAKGRNDLGVHDTVKVAVSGAAVIVTLAESLNNACRGNEIRTQAYAETTSY